ncbi:MAG TPA: hypothetical protein VE398_11375 [Acidobacteriota bacterium]|nr:hypothetical protein [Acidobacteriota bacterium]
MRRTFPWICLCLSLLLISTQLMAQQASGEPAARQASTNRLITFNGTLKDSNGLPRVANIGITFALYASQEGGEPLWRESQSVQTDEQGLYTALLGSTEKEGLPLEVFNDGKARWLGVQVQGEKEQPRVLLVAVPYALKAADADTVGGRPLTSFVLYEDLAKIIEKQVTPAMIVAQNAVPGPGVAVKNGFSGVGNSSSSASSSQMLSGGSGPPRVGAYEANSNTGYGLSTAPQTSGSNNSYFGYSAGSSTVSPAASNSIFGSYAGYSNGSASENSYFGFDAGYYSTGGDNAMFGACAGCWGTTVSYNSVFGARAANFLSTGSNNSIFGHQAAYNIGAGSDNAFFGRQAGFSNTANENSFFGTQSGSSNSTGGSNAFFGYQAGRANTTAPSNSFFGYQAGQATTTAGHNAFFGTQAGYSNITGAGNALFGDSAGYSNTANYNSMFGWQAGYYNTSGTANSFFGDAAGHANTSGNYNSFFGDSAGAANTTGNLNSFFGASAGIANTTGYWNNFLGYQSGFSNTSGNGNNFLGYLSGYAHTSNGGNTFLGDQAGKNEIDGITNSFFGAQAGLSVTHGGNNTLLGAYSDGAAAISNATALGYRASVTQSNSLVLGSINGVNGGPADTKVGIGTTAPVSHLNIVSTSTASPRGVANEQYNNGMDGVQFRGRKARGTPAAPAALLAGDVLGNYVFDGHDGSAFGTGVQIRPVTEEAWTPTAHGAYLALWTTPPGTITNTEKLRITGSGYVGIGTTTPTERLHVIGNLRISGAYLQGAPEEPVPDYVFEPDYKLMPIEELQKYVQKEKHLPNVPNAMEIKEKGMNLGELQMKLLAKIEELTLYTVQQAKTNQEQKAALDRKDAEVATLNARLAALENMMDRLAKQEQK